MTGASSNNPVGILVVAKAPVPGEVKTRLAATIGAQASAAVAAAAVLDTLDTVAAAPVAARVLALSGDLDAAVCGAEIRSRAANFMVIGQRGVGLAERLANAHADAATSQPGLAFLQIGMDTPQITADLIVDCARRLRRHDALIGPARDGGWWLLGLTNPHLAGCLRTVPMSQPDTGSCTLAALQKLGIRVGVAPVLDDVDTAADVIAVRGECAPDSRFVQATRAIGD
ncbi:MAG: DUF2064 domain-containing protein [Mycobacterium sp.]|nr:DUF2064 domain-containing protein [Mycobacterium sp.]